MKDKQLVRQAREGDETAWTELVRQHQEALFRLAYLHLGDAAEAQDAAQEALIRVYRSLHRFDDKRELKPWMLSIAANVARNRKRSLGRYWAVLKRWREAREEIEEDFRASEARGESAELLWEAIRSLNGRDSEILYLRYFLELPVRECAEVLNVAEGTIKSRTTRALLRLKEKLASDFDDPAWRGKYE